MHKCKAVSCLSVQYIGTQAGATFYGRPVGDKAFFMI